MMPAPLGGTGDLCIPVNPETTPNGAAYHCHCDRNGYVRCFLGEIQDCGEAKKYNENRLAT